MCRYRYCRPRPPFPANTCAGPRRNRLLVDGRLPRYASLWPFSPVPAHTAVGLPNLDYTTYVTLAAIVGGAASLLVCGLYRVFIQDLPLRIQFLVAGGSRLIPAVTELAIARRFNLDVGISDQAAFLVAGSALGPASTMLTIMPIAQLATQLATPGLETVSFSLIAASATLGKTIALMSGLLLTNWFEVDSTSCDFDSYPELLFFANVLLPIGGLTLYTMVD